MAQTAVEWLLDTMQNSAGMEQPEIDKVFKQAKELEKQQIIDAVNFGQNNHTCSISLDKEKAEEYYSETYGEKAKNKNENEPTNQTTATGKGY